MDEIVRKILSQEIPYSKEKCPVCPQHVDDRCLYNFKHSSTDALYVHYSGESIDLYFIEFKKEDLFNQFTKLIPEMEELFINLRKYLSKISKNPMTIAELESCLDIQIDEDSINESRDLLKESKSLVKKPCKDSLRLKPLESLFCIMPWVYKLYCENTSKTPNLENFQSFLLECKKHYIVIHEIQRPNPNSGRCAEYAVNHSCRNNEIPYEIQRLSPYPFFNINFLNGADFNNFIDGISNPEKLLDERMS
ncbi:hypothetical protein [Methanobacterium formicicum]|uniref:hypothetical protein n=1 Tax=Methanobacterium formicicum TaxID=2162 RepID=UPI002412AEB7|nr:hypothetical protein [Methanobacterium formicicum]MDG3546607.1 hypothetical protein [Methanobacterium formicicum]